MFDTNIIQAPELIRRLTTRLGLRQPHITPTLNNGVQAVVVLDDVSQSDAGRTNVSGPIGLYAGFAEATGTTGNEAFVSIFNSALLTKDGGSGRCYRIVKMRVHTDVDVTLHYGWRDNLLGAGANGLRPRERRTIDVAQVRGTTGDNLGIQVGTAGANVITTEVERWVHTGKTFRNDFPTFVLGPQTGLALQSIAGPASFLIRMAFDIEEE